MAKLKPIGSEKLEGNDKLQRIMEIANYGMTSTISENTSDYSINLIDGATYHIVKEKSGYIIKKGINESDADYIEPMRNRRYYSSYGQALKRLNLLIKEVNSLHDVTEEVSLYGEQKKFVLKTPKSEMPAAPEMAAPATPVEPPMLPEPELPMADAPVDDMEVSDTEMSDTSELMPSDIDTVEEKVNFKVIQKLTGKLTQKIRTLDSQEGMTSEDIKYVINMVLSSLDLSKLSPEDMEDVMTKFEDVDAESEMGDEDMGMEPDMDMDMDVDMEADVEVPAEPMENAGPIFDAIFKESKVDKVLSKYFEITENEKKIDNIILEERQKEKGTKSKMMSEKVGKLSTSLEQELAGKKFLEENTEYVFVGRTNKNNLVFESKNKQIKVSPEGIIL
jgi:hypothetical protein